MITTKYGETQLKGSGAELRADLSCIAQAFKNNFGEEEARKAVELGLMPKEERNKLFAEKLRSELPDILMDLVKETLGPKPADVPDTQPEPTPEPAPEPAPEPEPEPPRFQRGDEVRFTDCGKPTVGLIVGTGTDPDTRYVLTEARDFPLVLNTADMEPTGRHFDLPLEKA